MKRLILLVAVGLVTFFVIYLLKNPDELDQLWLYVIGLGATAIQLGKKIIDKLHGLLAKTETIKEPVKTINAAKPTPFIPAIPISAKS